MPQFLSDQLTADFIQAIIVSLRQDVVPHVRESSARVNADLLTRLLYMLENRFRHRGADLRTLLAADTELVELTARLLHDAPADNSPGGEGDYFSIVDKLEQQVLHQELKLDAELPQLVELASAKGPKQAAAATILRMTIQAQSAFLAAQDPDILKGSYVCYQGGRIEEERPSRRPATQGTEVSEASLTQHLQGRFPGCRVEAMSVMAGGFSKITIFFTLVQNSGKAERLVMRKDIAVRLVTNVDHEFTLLQHIFETGFPVAEPRWIEEDPAVFAGRFMVSDRVSGSTDISLWTSDPASVQQFARQLARTMVDLHALKLDRLGFPPEVASMSAGDAMLRELDRWQGELEQTRVGREAYPLDKIALLWLRSNIPPTLYERPACLTHGDIGFHNLMIDRGRVTALLDWEFSHVGDPVEDLVYTRPFIEKIMDWEAFKSLYYELGGVHCTAEEEFFHLVWSKARNPITGAKSATLFTEHMPDSTKFAVGGFVLPRYLSLEAANLVAAAVEAK